MMKKDESLDSDRAIDWAFEELEEELKNLKSAAKKVVMCFPEDISEDTQEFNIPAYIINELREAIKEENNGRI